MKPSDTQLKDLNLKLKTLNKEIFFEYIIEKLNSYNNMTYGNNIKTFIVIEFNSEIIICGRIFTPYQRC
jgi:hypothetical protein